MKRTVHFQSTNLENFEISDSQNLGKNHRHHLHTSAFDQNESKRNLSCSFLNKPSRTEIDFQESEYEDSFLLADF